jgi:hypothetical protein
MISGNEQTEKYRALVYPIARCLVGHAEHLSVKLRTEAEPSRNHCCRPPSEPWGASESKVELPIRFVTYFASETTVCAMISLAPNKGSRPTLPSVKGRREIRQCDY